MASESDHQLRAQRNEEFAASLDPNDPTKENWAVVAAFYSALHYVQSYLVKNNIPCGDHLVRNEIVKKDKKLRNAYVSYHYLYTLSRTARYECKGLPANAYSRGAKPHLAAVKKQVEHALKN